MFSIKKYIFPNLCQPISTSNPPPSPFARPSRPFLPPPLSPPPVSPSSFAPPFPSHRIFARTLPLLFRSRIFAHFYVRRFPPYWSTADLPPLPHSYSYRRSFDAIHLKRRRRRIKRFVLAALKHPALRDCDAMLEFLSPECDP